MQIEQIKKRDGRVVSFDRHKIEIAIQKACIATNVDPGMEKIIEITDQVIEETLEFAGTGMPGVEDLQDTVEKMLAKNDLFDVSKAYILYRREREAMREKERQELLERMEKHELKVKKRDGSIVPFDLQEITRAIQEISTGYEHLVNVDELVSEAKLGIFDGMTTEEITEVVTMGFRARIENDPAFSYIATRSLFNNLYKKVLGLGEFAEGFEARYRSHFREKIEQGIEAKRYDERMRDFDFNRLSEAMRPERDKQFAYMGAATLYERYFMKDLNQTYLEVPQYFWMRVAMGLSLLEQDKTESALRFYDVISQLRYVPSTPTLFHSGTAHSQMSSCYITTVEDDLHDIFKSFSDNAQLSKWSGGIGNDWTNIRATGAQIKSTNVGSQGVIPFLKIADATTAAINRSGKRRGAACVYLEAWHFDVEDFLELRKNTGDERRRTHDTNTSNWIPDLFIKRVMEDGNWTLFSPNETPDLHHIFGSAFDRRYEEYEQMAERGEIRLYKVMKAKDLWRKMLTMLFETGHPWITFKDPCNVRSPQDHCGVVHSSNLCTEITLNTSSDETAVCNLGSVNLARHIVNGRIDNELLKQTVRTAMRMLDNVIDLNFYPTEEAKRSNMKHRPVGLGVMGLQDALYKLGISFDSDAAVSFTDEAQEFISYYAILSSSENAKEKGAYESYPGSKWERGLFPLDTLDLLEKERGVEIPVARTSRMDWSVVRDHVKQYGMRNSNCMAVAPTATIANISGVLPSIEPIYKNLYVKSNVSGEFTIVNQYLVEDLKQLGMWNQNMIDQLKYYDGSIQQIPGIPSHLKEKYKEVFEVDTYWMIKHAAYRGKWIDQSQSVNIFCSTTSGSKLSNIYLEAWRMGLKTTYYLRTLAATGVEKSTIDINKKYDSPTATPSPQATVPASSVAGKAACSITDPECEACQ